MPCASDERSRHRGGADGFAGRRPGHNAQRRPGRSRRDAGRRGRRHRHPRGIERDRRSRRSSSIVEAISAEDIGKLPDVSIAESLARLPGLTAQRLDGRSQVISIRGLAPTSPPPC
jgi:hypothetical protein